MVGTSGGAIVHCDLAETPQQQQVGLSRARFAPKAMLFDFHMPKVASMTMHETTVPLGMMFIDENGTVRQIVRRAGPGNPVPYTCPIPVRWVLEATPAEIERLERAGARAGMDVTMYLPHSRTIAA